MTLMTTAHLLDRYGPLLTEPQLAEVLHIEQGTLRNSRTTLGIPVSGKNAPEKPHRCAGFIFAGAVLGAVSSLRSRPRYQRSTQTGLPAAFNPRTPSPDLPLRGKACLS